MSASRRGAAIAQPRPAATAAGRRSAVQIARDIALFFAAPFVTLAYLLLFPFIAAALLAQAWRHRKDAG